MSEDGRGRAKRVACSVGFSKLLAFDGNIHIYILLTVLSKLWYLSTERHTLTMEAAVTKYFCEPNWPAPHFSSEEGGNRCLRNIDTVFICQFTRRHALEDLKPAVTIRFFSLYPLSVSNELS